MVKVKLGKVKQQPLPQVPDIRGPSIQISQLENGRGARYIIGGAKVLIFVKNPPPVRGKMSSPRGRPNEVLTSSAV